MDFVERPISKLSPVTEKEKTYAQSELNLHWKIHEFRYVHKITGSPYDERPCGVGV